ncbi:MAG: ParB/RepB/Spo0J family partition protein [Armatimonadota bacterium]|nr:ParB/RepB/Spo0J family partition protein [Armatimonadota bacterium]MDR7438906.1 ParB/RepB/Spo0J family partition protein [Armatimonadota bacterium]MDR7562446.1 ParB/RepB/Spo0J family partition protein [Armatimonadota bacterium]MDR7567034.1 ParB/RepB/Spo0J family partition protein [Armatimonadota bacterium]MDR7601159.1 ParB/RepB/Spo0J family partition protein [Armatimonadota bacterium]
MSERQRRGLGRGLGALIPGAGGVARGEPVELLPVERIRPSSVQPRQEILPESLEELVASIRAHGVLQPVLVRPVGGEYELVAGERRWRAAILAGLERIPALVRPLSDAQALQVALVENLQREDLNPVERARAFQRLISEFGLTQQQVAEAVGLSQPTVANALRLLALPEPILRSLEEGRLREAHGRLLLSVEDPLLRERLWRAALEQGLSVRALQERITRENRKRPRPQSSTRADPDVEAVLEALRVRLQTQVRVRRGRRKGVLEIEFYSEEDLARLCDLLLGGPA